MAQGEGQARGRVQSYGPLLWVRWDTTGGLYKQRSPCCPGWSQTRRYPRAKAEEPGRRLLHCSREHLMGWVCAVMMSHTWSDRQAINQACTMVQTLMKWCCSVQTLSCEPEGVSSRVSVLPRLESWELGCSPGLEIFEPPIWFLEKN